MALLNKILKICIFESLCKALVFSWPFQRTVIRSRSLQERPSLQSVEAGCGVRRGAFGWDIALQAGRSWDRFLMESLKFFIDLILPSALWFWCWLNLWFTRSISWRGKGGRCLGPTTFPPSSNNCLEIWKPQTPWTARACPDFTFTFTVLGNGSCISFVWNEKLCSYTRNSFVKMRTHLAMTTPLFHLIVWSSFLLLFM